MPDDATIGDDGGEIVVKESLISVLRRLERRQFEGFTSLERSMESKASKEDMARIEARMEDHTRQLTELQTWRRDRETSATVHRQRDERTFTRKQKIWGAVVAVLTIIAMVLGPVLGTLLAGH